jgi:hypothetical protein
MSTTQILPITPRATSRPGIVPARAEILENYRERLAQKPCAFDVMKDARVARSMYQRNLLRQFIKFLASRLPFARRRGVNDPAASPIIGRILRRSGGGATVLGIMIGGFLVAAPARSQDASSAQCPTGYAPYGTVCIHDSTGDVVNGSAARTFRPEAEAGCVPGYWRFREVCISLATGDVELATEQTYTAARQLPKP